MILRTLELNGGDDLNCHDGFQDHWFGISINFAECTNGGKAESKFRRIDCVEGTIFQYQATSSNGVSR